MNMEIYCKTALSKSKLPGIDYSLNPYYGCEHSCIYCYVPSLFGIDRNEWGYVKIKRNIPNILMKELKKRARGIVGISSSTDAYQSIEEKYEITKKCLLLLLKHDFPIDILTKSDLIARDVETIKKFGYVKVGVTITSMNDDILPLWEPNAPHPAKRLKAIKKFVRKGIHTYIFFGPIFPLMDENEMKYCIEEFIDAGVDEIIVDRLHIKKGIMESIGKSFPDKIDEIKKNVYGNFYENMFKKIKEYGKKINISKAWE